MTATFEYIGISVRDLATQQDFYASVFGLDALEAELDLPAAGIRTAIIRSLSGLKIELIERTGSTPHAPRGPHEQTEMQGFTHLALRVDDLRETVRAVSAAGGTLISAPATAQRPGVQFAYVSDPEGNLLELVSDLSSG